jgi:hypothetical protein
MAEATKFTEDELKSINELQVKYNQITMAMGQLTISKHNLELREEALKSTLEDTRNSEQDLAKSLNKKYGQGTLDIESGEFTPTPVEETTETTPEVVEEAS